MRLTKITEGKPPRKKYGKARWASYSDEQLMADHESSAMSGHPVAMKRLAAIQREISRRRKERGLTEKDDVSTLPLQTMKEIQKNINEGAKDANQLWANALELVHKAYEIAQVQRPELTMDGAWKQYEENIEFAVKALAKWRGVDGEWRSGAVTELRVAEGLEDDLDTFSLETDVDGLPVVVKRTAENIDQVIQPFFDHNITDCDIEIKHRSPNHIVLYFCNEKGRTGDKVVIKKVS